MPETGNQALDAITRRQNLAIDSTVAWFERELREIMAKAQLRTLAELTKRLKVEGGRVLPNAANQRVLREIEGLFELAMQRAGYDELLQELAGSFGNQFEYFDEMLKVLNVEPPRFGKADTEFFAETQESVADTLRGIVRNAAELMQQRALLSIGGLRPEDLAEAIARESGKAMAHATTIADTAQSTFYRTIAERGFARIEARQPQAQPLQFGYYGPDDKLNRRFCRDLLDAQAKGRVYTKAEIEAMDNGQLPNPFLTAGGYRCRHQWTLARAIPATAAAKAAAEAAADPQAVVRVGRMPRDIAKQFAPRNPEYTVVLTQERLDHFSQAKGRAELFNARQVTQAVLDPEFVYRDRKNADTGIFYRQLDDQHLLAVTVRFAERKGKKKHSILTAHPVRARGFRRLPRRYLVWQRKNPGSGIRGPASGE